MKFLHGEYNLLRVLDEIEFWKLQEVEHTVVIEQIAPNLEPHFLDQLYDFRNLFAQSESEAVRLIETYNRALGNINQEMKNLILDFINYVIDESENFISFLNDMKENSQAILENAIIQIVINHIIRESQYFIGIAQTITYSTY